jgi:group II intron reverse transcriptase/maturase
MARKERRCRFENLAYLLNAEGLKECFYMLKKGKATGIDRVDENEYESNLEANIQALVDRMKRQAYKPLPVRRVYIPKANGKMRPLGIPAIEDKIVQMGITRILEAIYEVDFRDCSFGFRPGRGCHYALSRLDKTIKTRLVSYIIDCDIKGFFDNVDHEWIMKFLGARISDKNLLRIIRRFLKAGYLEEGKNYSTEKGTPQGGVISPVLANIYLHYVLDQWIELKVKKECRGVVEMVRYADDFVICVQYKDEAEKILNQLRERLQKFGLELAEDKTRVIKFGRFAEGDAKRKGRKPDTFNFLGFAHFNDRTRQGKFKVGRRTERKKFNTKIREMNQWLKEISNAVAVKEWWGTLCAKLRGHYNYYGVSGNYTSINRFYFLSCNLVYKWINRRSQRRSMNRTKFFEYIDRFNLPRPAIVHNLYAPYGC